MSNQGCQCGQAHGACTTEFQYAVKIVCGIASSSAGGAQPPVAPGAYRTAINIHNPDKCKNANFRWKVAVALPNQAGTVSSFQRPRTLLPDAAMEIDCPQVMSAVQPPLLFIKGYVVLESDIELDIVAVYTGAQTATGPVTTFYSERVQARCVPKCEDLELVMNIGFARWQTISPTTGPAVVLSSLPSVWASLFGASWISAASGDSQNAIPGVRSYQFCFTLCSGFTVPQKFPIQVLADNSAQVFLNTSPIGTVSGFTAATTLTVDPSSNPNMLHAGLNCFRVDVTNGPGGDNNPTGFALAGIVRIAGGKCPCAGSAVAQQGGPVPVPIEPNGGSTETGEAIPNRVG
jgi:hypothetical protein